MAANPIASREALWRDLDPYTIAGYLNAILDTAGLAAFALALQDMAAAKGLTMSSLVEDGVIVGILRACHLRLTVTPR